MWFHVVVCIRPNLKQLMSASQIYNFFQYLTRNYTVLTNAYYLEQISKDVIERTLSINQVFHNPVSHTYYVFLCV